MRGWMYRFRQLAAYEARAAWFLLMAGGMVTVWVLTAQWPESSREAAVACCVWLAAGHLLLTALALDHRGSRLASERYVSVRIAASHGMPMPPKDTWFGRQCRYAVSGMLCRALCEAMLCHGFLSAMPAGWFAMLAHFGLRQIEQSVWSYPDAVTDEETENSVALTVEMAHALISAALGLYAWFRA